MFPDLLYLGINPAKHSSVFLNVCSLMKAVLTVKYMVKCFAGVEPASFTMSYRQNSTNEVAQNKHFCLKVFKSAFILLISSLQTSFAKLSYIG